MPLNGFSVGRDITLSINTDQGVKRFSLITGFSSKPQSTDQRLKGIDGITRHLVFPEGWQGTFNLERQDNTLDDYWATIEENYYSGLSLGEASITETITEVDGSISQYRYQGVIFKLNDAGDWKGDKSVSQSLDFLASRRIKVS